MKHLFLLFAATSSAGFFGCSGPNTDDLFGGSGGAHASTVVGVTSSSAKGVTTTTGVNGTSVTSNGVTTSATVASAVSVGPTASSSSSGGGNTVYCNGAPCTPGDICCFNPNGPGDHCGQSGTCDGGYVELTCNGPEDCPGQVCCAKLSQGGQTVSSIACHLTCLLPNEAVVCSQAQPNVCPPNEQCQPTGFLGDGYRLCQ